MLLGVLTALAVLGGIVLLVVLFLQRGREGIDLSLGGLMRVYLYLASLAGVVVFAVGLAGVDGGPRPQIEPAFPVQVCPPGQTCPPFPGPPGTFAPVPDDRLRQQGEDLVRGVTFLVFGGIFWGAHWWARRALSPAPERESLLFRSYLILGTAIFGIATIALLPTGIYQALSFAVVNVPGTFRQGAGEALGGGLAALPIWLIYLWLVQRVLRAPVTRPTTVA